MADWIGVEGEDVFRDGEPGFNVILEVVAGFERAAERRAVMSVVSRFPATFLKTETVDTVRVGDARVPGASRYRVTVFVPSGGIRDAGAGTPLETLLDVVNDRVIDPITGELMDLR